jgi:regulator of sirC expression with transglutaminase-like and TPR domain
MNQLSALLAGLAPDLNLDEAALSLAAIECPGLDAGAFLAILDSYAVELAGRLRDSSGEAYVAEANRFLFEENGFAGNAADYYNPANSCLNEALAAKTGIPITLSVIYIEIARRLAKPVFGIGLPGHFIVQYDDESYSTYIDPFHGGRLLDAAECLAMVGPAAHPGMLARVDNRQIIARMINNLRGVYFSRKAYRKSVQILNLLLEANPYAAEEYKQRGVAYLQMEQTKAAKEDFERYLELAPEAADRAEIERHLASLKRWLVGMN